MALVVGGVCLTWFAPEIQSRYVKDARDIRSLPLLGRALYDWPSTPGYLLALRIGGIACSAIRGLLILLALSSTGANRRRVWRGAISGALDASALVCPRALGTTLSRNYSARTTMRRAIRRLRIIPINRRSVPKDLRASDESDTRLPQSACSGA
jgi:hypothetical protein